MFGCSCSSWLAHLYNEDTAAIPIPFVEAELGVIEPSDGFEGGAEASSSCLIVDVEVDLLKPLVNGARCVSFNSELYQQAHYRSRSPYILLVNFHDMVLCFLFYDHHQSNPWSFLRCLSQQTFVPGVTVRADCELPVTESGSCRCK